MKTRSESSIVLVPVGILDGEIIEKLKNGLRTSFNREIVIGSGMPEPDYAYNRKRRQYLSTAIVHALREHAEYRPYEKALGIVDHDLFVPELNFVFGEAGRSAAVISLTRLRQKFYGLPEEKSLFYKRVLTEAVHELGHTYGLRHCKNPECVMFFSNNLMDTDRKGTKFCSGCRNRLSQIISSLNE